MDSTQILFKAFVFKGCRFLAVTQEGGVAILTDQGASYGAWMSIESFEKSQDWDEYNFARMQLGKVRLLVQPI